MANGIDKKTEKTLLDALAYAKADSQRMREKRERQVWKKISNPCKLVDLLSTFTKIELDDIRKNLELGGLSSLKKSELIQELVKLIPAKFKIVLSRFDLERYHLIKKIAKNSGIIKTPENFSTSDAEFFMGYGVSFPGTHQNEKVLVMPEELVETFIEIDGFELQKVIHRNDEWVRLTHGMLNFYGVLDTSILINKLTELTNQEVSWKEYFNVMSMACDYYGQVRFDSHGFSDHRVFDVEKLKEEHHMRSVVDYYPFSMNQLLKAAEPKYVDQTPEMKDLISLFVDNYEVSKREMDDIAWEIISLINLDADTSALIQHLQTRFEMDSLKFLQRLADRLVALHNHTRMWVLKGYSPNELSQKQKQSNPFQAAPKKVTIPRAKVVTINSNKKFGRNDPCPCGSGKKYKKCCGK